MYNAQIVKERINTIIKKQKISASKLLADCDLNPNTINKISDKNGLASFSLAKIADYLEVSVDYLLGRTDEPELKSTSGSINSHNTVIGYNNKVSGNSISYNAPEHNENLDRKFDNSTYYELLSYLETLSSSQRRHALADILDILEENYPL